MTGSKLIKLEDLKCDEDSFIPEEIFGFSKRAILTEFETNLTGTMGDKDLISERLEDLRYKIRTEENKNLKEVMKKRLSYLEGKTAIIAVGGLTEVEVAENRDKIIDCLNSCKSAIDNGILPGGGTSFIHVIRILEGKLKDLKKDYEDNNNSERFDNHSNHNGVSYDFIMGIECYVRALKVWGFFNFFYLILFILFYYSTFFN